MLNYHLLLGQKWQVHYEYPWSRSDLSQFNPNTTAKYPIEGCCFTARLQQRSVWVPLNNICLGGTHAEHI
jgi:hypothetical protein